MRYLPLNRGKFALVDDEDYDELRKYEWRYFLTKTREYARRYHIGRGNKLHWILMHRQLMGFPEKSVDHKDRNGLNNQKSNLRLCTHSQNLANTKNYAKTEIPFKGVSKLVVRKPNGNTYVYYKAQLLKTLTFKNPLICAYIYDVLSLIHFKEFACNNDLRPSKRLRSYVRRSLPFLKPHSDKTKRFKQTVKNILREEKRI